MKNLITTILLVFGLTINAQPRGQAKMMPILMPGYYINAKNDTVKGQVQINPEDKTDFYKVFAFKTMREKKPKIYDTKRVSAYGFKGRDFVRINYKGQGIFIERLVTGRIRFYQYQFNGKVDGNSEIESYYFVKDTGTDAVELRATRKISNTYYKHSLKPYLKDQAMLWSDLDKYTFDKNMIIKTLVEFNRFYP